MSRTDLDATTLANSLRMRAGDGSIEWVSEPIQASVLLDIADMLDENAKLRAELGKAQLNCDMWHDRAEDMRNRLSAKQAENAKLRELCADMWWLIEDLDATPYVTERQGNNPAITWLDEDLSVHESCKKRIRELGVEVDG